jgi:hypothetical protein
MTKLTLAIAASPDPLPNQWKPHVMHRKLTAMAVAAVAIVVPFWPAYAQPKPQGGVCPKKTAPYFVTNDGWEVLGRDGRPMDPSKMTSAEILAECKVVERNNQSASSAAPSIIVQIGQVLSGTDVECDYHSSLAPGLVPREPSSVLCMSRPSKGQRAAFETAVAAEFQALPACRGITLRPATDLGDLLHTIEGAELLELGYDLHLNRDSQSFSVIWLGDFKGVEIRATSAREMMQHVCSLAKGQGGAVIQ